MRTWPGNVTWPGDICVSPLIDYVDVHQVIAVFLQLYLENNRRKRYTILNDLHKQVQYLYKC